MDEDEEISDEEDYNYSTDDSWSTLMVAAMITWFIAFIISATYKVLDFWYRYSITRDNTPEYHSFYLSLYYGNNTITENEFLESMEGNAEYEGERSAVKYSVLINEAMLVMLFFTSASGILLLKLVDLMKTSPHLVEKYFNIVYTIGNYLLSDSTWFLIPALTATLHGLAMVTFMAMFFLITQNLLLVLFANHCYIFFVAGLISSCYLIFLMYYLEKMWIANFIDKIFHGDQRPVDDVLKDAIAEILDFYLGTACFNATLVLPPILALKRLIWKPNDLENIHHEYTSKSYSIRQFFRDAYMTVFIADYSSIITVTRVEDAVDATDTIFRLVNNNISVQSLRRVDNRYTKFTIVFCIGYFILLKLWYTYTGQTVDTSQILFKSCFNVITVIGLPFVWIVCGTIMSTYIIGYWFNEEDQREIYAVAA